MRLKARTPTLSPGSGAVLELEQFNVSLVPRCSYIFQGKLESGFRLANGEVQVRMIRRSAHVHAVRPPQLVTAREKYFFYERNTGVAHFHVETDEQGRFPVEQAAGLLAMHCMVRNQTPSDYVVMVEANTGHLEDLTEKAQKLLEAGRSVKTRVKLTRREEEVLNGVVRSLANKEIAASLNLSERTVKFHVSSLLAKFHVRGRMELVREAAQMPTSAAPIVEPVATREARPFVSRIMNYRRPAAPALLSLSGREAVAQ
jgi:DNA-binding CsgD family transcriptional regulator